MGFKGLFFYVENLIGRVNKDCKFKINIRKIDEIEVILDSEVQFIFIAKPKKSTHKKQSQKLLFYDILIREKKNIISKIGDRMKSYIDLGFIKIHYYSLMYIIAFFLGIFIASRDKVAEARGIKDK